MGIRFQKLEIFARELLDFWRQRVEVLPEIGARRVLQSFVLLLST